MLEAIISVVGAAFIGCFGWLFINHSNLSARVAVLDQKDTDLNTLINSRFDEVDRRLGRIENAMNGALKGH